MKLKLIYLILYTIVSFCVFPTCSKILMRLLATNNHSYKLNAIYVSSFELKFLIYFKVDNSFTIPSLVLLDVSIFHFIDQTK